MKKVLIFFLLIGLVPFPGGPSSVPVTFAEDRTLITAHRGSSAAAPENTLGSIRKAIEDGAHYAEIDVQQTSDGVPVLMHDINARRTAGINKPVYDIPYAELASASAGAWFHPAYQDEKVPTLEQALTEASGRIRLNIELKDNGRENRLPEETVRLIRRYDAVESSTVTSFNFHFLQRIKALEPDIKTGLIFMHKPANLQSLLKNEAIDAISIAHPIAAPDLLEAARLNRKLVFVWTVNDRSVMKAMLDLGVDSIITDHPSLLRDVIKSRREK